MATQQCIKCGEIKPLSEFGLSNRHRLRVEKRCKICANTYKYKWALANAESRLSSLERYSANNREKYNRAKSAWKKRNPEKNAEISKRWRQSRPEIQYGYVKAFYKRNPGKVIAWHAKRNADKIRATPKWADKIAIEAIYQLAALETKRTGVKHVVDHILPLRSKIVCGLHVESNLRVITKRENCIKSNKLLPEFLDEFLGCGK